MPWYCKQKAGSLPTIDLVAVNPTATHPLAFAERVMSTKRLSTRFIAANNE